MARCEEPVGAPERRAARLWLGLALGVLVVAGLFALAVVVGRMPPFDRFVTDPLFFKRCLVAHVNLALFAWFYSFVAALFFLLPGRGPSGRLARVSPYVGGAGVAALLIGAGVPDGQPVLSNYIPTVDHWVFRLGQALFGLGVVASLANRRLLPGRESAGVLDLPPAACSGLRVAAVALLLAATTFVVSALRQPAGVPPDVRYELLVWGGGHVLQLVNAIAMVAIWITLLAPVLGRSPVSQPAARLLFATLLLPWSFAPLLAFQGGQAATAQAGFTHLMQWGIFPPVTIFLVLCLRAVARSIRSGSLSARDLADPRLAAFAVSAGLTVLGFGLGAAIRGSNTMVPAHYHASVGAVTVAFMAVTYPLLQGFRLGLPATFLRRAAAWQPLLYGAGMLLFAAGFALAGAHGMGRKVYGAEQAARSFAETVGLGVMGIGGFVAIAGGVLFLVIAGVAWSRGPAADEPSDTALSESAWRWRYGAHRSG